MSIISHKHIYLTVSGLLVLASLVAIGLWGLKLGIDFTGGSLLEVEFEKARPTVEAVRKMFESVGLDSVLIQPTSERGMIFRFRHIDEPIHQVLLSALAGVEPLQEKRFDTIGPTIGKELKQRSIIALGLAIAAIILYIAWAFRRVSKPVSSWKYGVAAILALIHDVTIPMGVFAAVGHYGGIEVDTLFITALLTILGFSVHDTIVVFDRIRENLQKLKVPEPYDLTVGRSIRETIGRSINTSLTVVLVLTAIFFWGGESTKYFSLVLIIGIVAGTYSSIFVASPLLVVWNKFSQR